MANDRLIIRCNYDKQRLVVGKYAPWQPLVLPGGPNAVDDFITEHAPHLWEWMEWNSEQKNDFDMGPHPLFSIFNENAGPAD